MSFLRGCGNTGKAVSLAMVTHWICNVALGQTFMSVVNAYGISTAYAFFGVVSLLGMAYISSAVPETKVMALLIADCMGL